MRRTRCSHFWKIQSATSVVPVIVGADGQAHTPGSCQCHVVHPSRWPHEAEPVIVPISRTKGRSRYMAASGRADAGPRHVRKKSFTSRVKRRTIRPRVPSAFALRWFPFCSGKASRIPVLTQPGNYTPHFPKDFLLTRPADREKHHVHRPGDQVKT